MRALRALARLLHAVLHMLHGLAIVLLQFDRLSRDQRQQRIRWWATKMLRVLGVGLQADGLVHSGATLLVSNHISWMDILAIHAVCPQARFVSKADVKRWPLLGQLVASAGTLFIERERKRDALRVVHQMAHALQQGEMVAVFPEGTTGDGHAVLPFHANLLQAAITTHTPVQPVVLRFSDPWHSVSPAVAYVGETTLLQSVWRVASAQGVTAHVSLLLPQGTRHLERRALADLLQQQIGEHLASGRSAQAGAPASQPAQPV
jgi:1-acyl-sn-glycerol-3-phosphate acyltransferase